MREHRTLDITLSEQAIRRMTLKVENDWSNPPMYSGVDRELLGSVYSLVNVPVQVWKAIQDFMTPLLDEPTEFGAMVEAEWKYTAGRTHKWIRILSERTTDSGLVYWQNPDGVTVHWTDLVNCKLIGSTK